MQLKFFRMESSAKKRLNCCFGFELAQKMKKLFTTCNSKSFRVYRTPFLELSLMYVCRAIPVLNANCSFVKQVFNFLNFVQAFIWRESKKLFREFFRTFTEARLNSACICFGRRFPNVVTCLSSIFTCHETFESSLYSTRKRNEFLENCGWKLFTIPALSTLETFPSFCYPIWIAKDLARLTLLIIFLFSRLCFQFTL